MLHAEYISTSPQVKEQEKVTTLEDFFKKTEAAPHLYWLPLTPEEILAKQKAKAEARELRAREDRPARR